MYYDVLALLVVVRNATQLQSNAKKQRKRKPTFIVVSEQGTKNTLASSITIINLHTQIFPSHPFASELQINPDLFTTESYMKDLYHNQ